tara:strand:+ start:849 stop:986 length:138 start_codon:yes stop_codon:yes gene_type:complete
LQFLEAGCHFLIEKPIATNIEDSEKFVARTKNRNLVLAYILFGFT